MGYALVGATAGELIGPVMGGLLYENLGHWAVFTAVEILIFFDIVLRVLVRDKSGKIESTSLSDAEASTETDPLLGGTQNGPDDRQETSAIDNKRAPASLSHIRMSWVMQLTTTLVATIVRCAMETVSFPLDTLIPGVSHPASNKDFQAIPLVISTFFGWSSAAAGGVMFALLVPMIASPAAGNLATIQGPGIISMVTCVICSAALVGLGYLHSSTDAAKVLFVAVLALVGLCIAIATSASTTGILILAKRLDTAFPAEAARPWPTEGMMMTGMSTSWALGLLLGPACASLFEFTDVNGWAHLCFALAGLSAAALICSIITWKTW